MNTLTLGHVETVTLPAGRRLLVTGRVSVALTGPVETIEVNGPATVGPFAVERIATLSPGSTRAAPVYPGVPVTVRDGEGVMQWEVSAPDFVELTPAQVAAGAVGMLGSNNAGGLVEPDGDTPSLGGAVTLPAMTTAAAAGTGPERGAHRVALGLAAEVHTHTLLMTQPERDKLADLPTAAALTTAQVLWWAVPAAVRRARSELTRRKAGKAALSQPCR